MACSKNDDVIKSKRAHVSMNERQLASADVCREDTMIPPVDALLRPHTGIHPGIHPTSAPSLRQVHTITLCESCKKEKIVIIFMNHWPGSFFRTNERRRKKKKKEKKKKKKEEGILLLACSCRRDSAALHLKHCFRRVPILLQRHPQRRHS